MGRRPVSVSASGPSVVHQRFPRTASGATIAERNPRWTAAARVVDLVTPQAAQTGAGETSTPWRADPRFTGDGYVLLDSHRVGLDDLRRDNAAALLAGLENPSPSTLPELVGAVCRRR